MKLKELKKRVDKIAETHPDMDVMVECEHTRHHVISAKKTRYNLRDGKFTGNVFMILTGEKSG